MEECILTRKENGVTLTSICIGLTCIKTLEQADVGILQQNKKLHTASEDYQAAIQSAAQSPNDQNQTRKLRSSKAMFEKLHKKSVQMAKAHSKGSGQATIWIPDNIV